MAAPKTFKSDDSVLDPMIKSHISTLYAAVDKFETMDVWGDHFTEDAVLKKGAVNIQGRENLIAAVSKGWATLQAREHIVYSVFPFGKNAEEVMLHGRSHNVSKEGVQSTFTWAARMHFRRSENGEVKIDKYTIIVDTFPETL